MRIVAVVLTILLSLAVQAGTSAPGIDSFYPASGSAGTVINITGEGFTGVTQIDVNGTNCSSYTVHSRNHASCTVATGTTSGRINIQTSDWLLTSISKFTYSSASWSFADGNGTFGINKNPTTYSAQQPMFAVFNSKLYSTWFESNGSQSQIRTSVYNGNDSSASWSLVDGNGSNGLNQTSSKNAYYPSLTSFNSKLYATWYEYSSGNTYQVRASVYNGNDSSPTWTIVDGNSASQGLNYASNRNADYPPQLADFNSKLYAAWTEYNGTAYQIRAKVYNGNDSSPSWSFVDGSASTGLNKVNNNSYAYAYNPRFVSHDSKLYLMWYENNSSSIGQIRTAVYNGNDSSPTWTFVDGNGSNGLNYNTARAAYYPVGVSATSKLYAAWYESNGVANQIRVKVYNGNDSSPSWSFVDGNGLAGLNKAVARSATYVQLAVFNSTLYAAWQESDTIGNIAQIRIAAYNGNDASPSWSMADGNGTYGINKFYYLTAQYPQLTAFNSKLYCGWYETAGVYQVRSAVKN